MLVIFMLSAIFYSPDPLPVAAPIIAVPPTVEETRTHWVVYWAQEFDVDTTLALAVSRAENWSGIFDAWSPTGCCIGAMQVNVAVWYGIFNSACSGSDLMKTRDNTCYGVLILKHHLTEANGNVLLALQAYGGWEQRTHSARRYQERITRELAD